MQVSLKQKALFRLRWFSNPEWWEQLRFGGQDLPNLDQLNLLDSYQTIERLLAEERSLIRWGSGESAHYFGGQNPTHAFRPGLQICLHSILANHHAQGHKWLFAIPTPYLKSTKSSFRSLPRGKRRLWKSSRYIFAKYCSPRYDYGNAFCFRPEGGLSVDFIGQLWDRRPIIVASHSEAYFNRLMDETRPHSGVFIKLPPINAFDHISNVLADIYNAVSLIRNTNRIRILVAAGPAAKPIVKELSRHGLVAYDIGNFFQQRLLR